MQFDLKIFLDNLKTNQPLSVAGIAIESPMTSIPYGNIKSGDSDLDYPRVYRGDKIFRILDDETEKELSLNQVYSEVEKFGGWLRAEGISWYIKDQIVQRYIVGGPQLLPLNIQSENQIVNIFGGPEYISMGRYGVEYHYLKSQFTIIWSRKNGKLDSIRVGDFTTKNESFEEDLLKGVLYIAGIRKIQLSRLEQSYTYDGLLEGRPTGILNNRIIEEAMEKARSYFGPRVHLIEPLRVKPVLKRPYRFGEPENIPAIRCIAEFTSGNPVKDEDADGSHLTLVWFQRHLAMPIDEGVRKKIESLNWDKLAGDFNR